MNKVYLAWSIVLSASVTLSVPLPAQLKYSAGIGLAVPIGGAADNIRTGYETVVAVSMSHPGSPDRIRLEVGVTELTDKTAAAAARRITSTTANFVLASVTEPTAPSGYVIAGIGSYHQRAAGKVTDQAGLNIGAGITFYFGAFGGFTEARLHYLQGAARIKLFPITFGFAF